MSVADKYLFNNQIEKGKRYPINLALSNDGTKFMSLQYKFKPSHIDKTQQGKVLINNKLEANITLPNISQKEENFKGTASLNESNEYILTFHKSQLHNHETTLENNSSRNSSAKDQNSEISHCHNKFLLLEVSTVLKNLRHTRNEDDYKQVNVISLKRNNQLIASKATKLSKSANVSSAPKTKSQKRVSSSDNAKSAATISTSTEEFKAKKRRAIEAVKKFHLQRMIRATSSS